MPRGVPIGASDETLDRICGVIEIFQAVRGYRFGIEVLLLSGFVGRTAGAVLDLGTGSGVLPIVLTRFDRGYNKEPADLYVAPLSGGATRLLVSDGKSGTSLWIIDAPSLP